MKDSHIKEKRNAGIRKLYQTPARLRSVPLYLPLPSPNRISNNTTYLVHKPEVVPVYFLVYLELSGFLAYGGRFRCVIGVFSLIIGFDCMIIDFWAKNGDFGRFVSEILLECCWLAGLELFRTRSCYCWKNIQWHRIRRIAS